MKKVLSIAAMTLIFASCSIFSHLPTKVEVPYNCPAKIKVTKDVSLSLSCKGLDTVFVGKDTVIFKANTP